MAKLTLYLRPSLGTLTVVDPGAEVTTSTGWTVGTNAPTVHKLMEVNAERSAAGWSAGALPTAAPIPAFDVLIGDEAITANFLAENWALVMKAIAVTSGGDQDGMARVRLWKTADKVNFTALTEALDLTAVTNLAVGAAQSMTGNLAPGALKLSSEYLALQIAWKITGAGGEATRDVLFREGSGVSLTTATIEEAPPLAPATPKRTDPSTRLAISLRGPDGGIVARWGPGEQSIGNVPKGLGFSTADPGLFKNASIALSRRPTTSWPDLQLLRDIEIYGVGGRTAWEGRLQEIPTHEAGDYSISPAAVGHAAALDDDPSFAEIYLDRDITKWGDGSTQRKIENIGFYNPGSAEVSVGFQDAGANAGSIIIRVSYEAGHPLGEQWYYGNGVTLGRFLFDFNNLGGGLEGFHDICRFLATDLGGSVTKSSKDYANATALAQELADTSGAAKYAIVQSYYEGAYAAAGIDSKMWSRPMVMGAHGLTLQGTWPSVGLYAADVIADIVKRCAPDLNFTTGTGGSIEPSTYAIPHLDFSEPGKGSDKIMGVNAYHQRSWGVEEGKRFFWRSAEHSRKRWRIRRSKGHGIDLLGPQAEDAINGVVVHFTDAGGQTRTITPLGVSTAYATSALLEDTSPTNPVNMAGISRKWGELSLSFVTDVPGATQVGYAWLRDKLLNANSRGSVVVTGLVEDDETGVLYPAWYMRAGDSAIVTDGDNIERRIIETNYDHDSLTNTCNMDSTPHKVEALMERMGLSLVGIVE